MRKLFWFAVGFAASCAGWVYGPAAGQAPMLTGAALFFFVVFFLFRGKHPFVRILCAVLLGASFGGIWYQGYESAYLRPAAVLDGVTREAVITVTDFSFDTGYGRGADGSILLEDKSYEVRIYLEPGDPLEPGDVLKGTFRFRLTVPGSASGGTYHAGNGIFLHASQEGEITSDQTEAVTYRMLASRLRREIQQVLERCIPADSAAFAKALLLGDTTALSYETDTVLKVSGIRHVAAVSGLHVSILFALASTVAFKNRYLSALLGIPLLAVFASLAGFTPSVTRACIMCGLMMLSQVINREYDGLTALGFSVLTMLLLNPITVASVSFQLSAASVLGIFLFSEGIRSWLTASLGAPKGKSPMAKIKKWLIGSVSTTLSAMTLSTPLCAVHFGTVSLIGVVTNLLVLWVISFLFYALMAVVAVYWLLPEAALLLGTAAGWVIRGILWVAGMLARIPFACLYTASVYTVLWLIFVYLLLGIFLLLPRKRPGQLLLCLALSLGAALGCAWGESMLYDTGITVLDVGQGQCVLLQSEGRNYLVDCGGENDAEAADQAAELLLSQGISHLDGLILTHMDRDHAGGAENLLSRIGADILILPPAASGMDAGDAAVIWADRELDLNWGSSRLTVFGENIPGSANENSLCILLDTEKCDILITGDRDREGERRLLESGRISKVDILVAGHHGSKNASSEELLDITQPETVCISVGAGNLYGHPDPETVKRLEGLGCDIYRTDLHGTVTVRR